jgi:filamentous hemagglutinin family protein
MKLKGLRLLSCATALLPFALDGQIVLDGTMGHAGALTGPNYQITAALGKQSGGNLFQSFSSFNLAKGELASFSGPNSVQNVLARVTGGTASSIDGTVQCTIPGASFFLINPAGVIFGPDAALDVKGSFTVTTANYLRFADGAKFNATVPSDSVLTTAAPAAFGFLKSNPKPVTMNNSHLSVLEGQSLSLVGGNIQLSGAALSAPDGAINLTSVASKGEVSATPNLNSFATGGDIVWTEGATVDVSGQQGGQVVIRGGTLTLDNNSAITAVTEGALNGEGINIGVKGGLMLEGGSVISTTTAGSGQSGDVVVNAGAITLSGGGALEASTTGTGNAGAVSVTANSLSIDGAGSSAFTGIESQSGSGASGNAGIATINVRGQLLMENEGVIDTDTYGSGGGGEINITAGSLAMWSGNSDVETYISCDSSFGATGAAGGVNLNVRGQLAMSGNVYISTDTVGSGKGGQVNVTAGSLTMTGGNNFDFSTTISSDTYGAGNAGQVTVTAGSLSINGQGFENTTGVSSQSYATGTGNAGNITVKVQDLLLMENGGEITAQTSSPSGKAGEVNVTAGSLIMKGDDVGYEFISSESNNGYGDAGNVSVCVRGQVAMSGTSYISSEEGFGSGNAGTVSVEAKTVSLEGEFVGISSASYYGGNGGDVLVSGSKLIQINDGATLTAEASSSPSSNSGAITFRGGNIQLNGGLINSEADGGNAGKVEVNASGLLSLYQSQILAGSHQQNGGVIGISAPYVALNQSSINANAYHTGGTIAIATPNFIESIGSAVTATSQTGHAGTVEISSPQLTLSGNLAALNLPILSAEAYLPAQCGQSLGGNVSSFIVLGRDGLPLDPGGWAASFPEEQDDHLRKHSDSRGK